MGTLRQAIKIATKMTLAIIVVSSSCAVWAASWTIEPSWAVTPESLDYLRKRHPDISSPLSLQRLLIDLSRSRPFASIQTEMIEGEILVRLALARSIGDIEVDSTSSMIENEVRGRLQRYLGQVDADEISDAMYQEAQRILISRGFYLSTITLKRIRGPSWNRIEMQIAEDYPCRVREVIFGFKKPARIKFDVEAGDICDQVAITNAIDNLEERLVEAGYYQKRIFPAEINYDKDTNSAILVIPGKLGEKISYSIETPIKDFLTEDLSEVDPSIIDPDAIASEILSNYRNAGYDDTSIEETKETAKKDGSIHYEFKVNPGPRYTITDIEFQGSYHFRESQLKEILGFDGLFSAPLNHDLIRSGIESLKARYQFEGFWDIKIPYPRIAKNSTNGQARLVFSIVEGQQRIFSELIIKGNNAISSEAIQELFSGTSNKPLAWTHLTELKKSLSNTYRSNGYLYAEFRTSLIQESQFKELKTSILLEIEEGKRTKFGDITIAGLVQTKEEVVQRELRFQQGDWFDPEKIEQTKFALVKLGIFSSVNIALSDTSSLLERRTNLPYTVTLREGRPGSVVFGPGWSFEDGARYVIESSYSNIAGTGRKIYTKGKISEEKTQRMISNKSLLGRSLTVGYIEPYVAKLPANVTVSANHRAIVNKGDWELSNSGEVSISHEFRDWLHGSEVALFYGLKRTRLETFQQDREPLIDIEGTRIGSIGIRYNADRRNDLIWTTAGNKISAEFSWARYGFGGNLNYFRTDFSISQFFEIADNWVIALGCSLSQYQNIKVKGESPDVLPTSERLEAGGSESNRGFNSATLGPIFNYYNKENELKSKVAGGSSRGVYKFELRHQLVERTFGLATFVDSSNVFFSQKQEKIFRDFFARDFAENTPPEPSEITENADYHFEAIFRDPQILAKYNYVSYGLALNWLTPLGSVDFSYGIPWKRCLPSFQQCTERGVTGKNKAQSGVFHVSIGANF